MAQQNEQPTVARTLRAAIRVGEDFYTIEETITLPIDASDEEITKAVDAGMRIYQAQRVAAESQIRELRNQVVSSPLPIQIRDPEAPASDKQRAYMDYLLHELGWDTDRLHTFAQDRNYDILTLNKREASELIDQLKRLLEARSSEDEPSDQPEAPGSQVVYEPARPEPKVVAEPARPELKARQAMLPVGDLATARQIKALERLAEERGIDIAEELRARYGGRALNELSIDEAGQLLTEWQQRPRNGRPLRRAA